MLFVTLMKNTQLKQSFKNDSITPLLISNTPSSSLALLELKHGQNNKARPIRHTHQWTHYHSFSRPFYSPITLTENHKPVTKHIQITKLMQRGLAPHTWFCFPLYNTLDSDLHLFCSLTPLFTSLLTKQWFSRCITLPYSFVHNTGFFTRLLAHHNKLLPY